MTGGFRVHGIGQPARFQFSGGGRGVSTSFQFRKQHGLHRDPSKPRWSCWWTNQPVCTLVFFPCVVAEEFLSVPLAQSPGFPCSQGYRSSTPPGSHATPPSPRCPAWPLPPTPNNAGLQWSVVPPPCHNADLLAASHRLCGREPRNLFVSSKTGHP